MNTDSRPASSHAGSKPSGMWQPPSLEGMQTMLPQYQFVSLLGRGGMGAVYKAVQVSLDRPVAIKVLPGDLIDDADSQFAERFKNEARTMAKMNHPAIVNVFDFGQTQTGLLFIVMEFIDGTDVARMIASQGKLPVEYALAITAHVCDALGYAHKNGIIHRDIKPANILINMDGAVKVADFGLAKSNDAAQVGLTKTNMAMGTPDFVAPEALVPGVPLDGRADLYAIGVMLYQMLTGEVPRGMWTMPGSKFGTDPRFDAIIGKAMQTDREARYQSAAEIRRDLDVILTVPLVKAGDSHSSAAIPKQSLPSKSSADIPARNALSSDAGGAIRKEAADPRSGERSHRKSSTGFYCGMAATVVVLGLLVLMFPGGKQPDFKTKADDKPKAAPASKPSKAKPAPVPKPVVAATPKPATTSASVAVPPQPVAPATVDTAPWTGAISLLPLLDVEKDTVKKGWKRKGDDLVSGQELPALLELPVIPPEEYDLRVRFTKTNRRDNISLVLARGDRSFVWQGGIYGNTVFGFGYHRGVASLKTSNPTLKTVASCFETGRAYTVQIAVRKTGVAAYLDGVKISELAADLAEMQIPESLKLRTTGALGVASFNTHYAVHSVELRAATGKAKLLREPVPATAPPMATTVPANGPSSADPVSQRLAQLEQQFRAAYEAQVGAVHKAAVADLNAKLSAALDRSITAVSQAGKLEEALALRNEKTLIQSSGTLPEEDAADVPETLKGLRKTWRAQMTSLLANRDKLATPLQAAYDRALAAYQDELTRASKLDEATRVKAVRDHISSQREAAAPPASAGSTVVTTSPTAPLGSSGKTPVPIAPIASPLPADKVLPPPPKATPEEVRELCEWVFGKGGSVELLDGGVRRTIGKLAELPKGKITLLHFYIYELPMNDEGRKWLAVLGRVADLESVFFHKNPGTMPMELFRGATKLKSLSVKPTAVDDAAFAHLTGLKSLEKLAISYMCKQFTGTGLGHITENLLEFETDSKTISAEGLAYLPRFKKLRQLDLTNSAVTDVMLQGLAALPDLEALEVTDTKLDGSFLAFLPANSKLRWLNLGRMKGFKPENFAHLARLKNLEAIAMPATNPGPAELAALAELGKLRTILFEDDELFTGEGFQGLKGFRSLTTLNLGACPITDAGLAAIVNAAPELKTLHLRRGTKSAASFTPAGFSTHLGQLRNLTDLVLEHGGYSDEWLPHIAQIKNLTLLSLQGTAVTDAGLAHLKSLPLGNLRLDQTGVTDAAIPILKTFLKLTYVNTGSNKMTDVGRAELKRILDGNKGK